MAEQRVPQSLIVRLAKWQARLRGEKIPTTDDLAAAREFLESVADQSGRDRGTT